jgi:hypothetical protein
MKTRSARSKTDRDAAIIAAVRARVVLAIGRRWGLWITSITPTVVEAPASETITACGRNARRGSAGMLGRWRAARIAAAQ